MEDRSYSEKKVKYAQRLKDLLEEYPKIIIVHCDNVGSNQMQLIRSKLRGKAVVLMGKNTQIRRVLNNHPNKTFAALADKIRSNIGLVFTKADVKEVKDLIESYKIDAIAKAGVIAPNDVMVFAGPTGMEPTQTSFLQALFIQSKIVKGQIEIISDVKLIAKGERVQPSHSALLAKLGIKPFKYGMESKFVFENGQIYDTKLLDFTENDLLAKMSAGIANIAAISIASSYPTTAMVPFSIARAFKNIVSICFATSYTFPLVDQLKNAASTAVAAPTASAASTAQAAKEEEKVEEEEEDADLGLDLFG